MRKITILGIILVHELNEDKKYVALKQIKPRDPWECSSGLLGFGETIKEKLKKVVYDDFGIRPQSISFDRVDDTLEDQIVLVYRVNSFSKSDIKSDLRAELLEVYPRKTLINPELFIPNQGEYINDIIKELNDESYFDREYH